MTAGPSQTPTAPPPSPGLTAPGLIVLLLLGIAVGATVDLLVSGKLGWGINIAFAITAVLAGWWARRRELWTAVLVAPVAFAVVVTVAMLVTEGYEGLTKTGLLVVTELALLAPGLWLGTVLAAVVVFVRRRATRGRPG